jgi:hypothetical protein
MAALLLLEYDAQADGIRQALLSRIEALAMACQGRLRFVATQRENGNAVREIMAVDLANAADAAALLARWRTDAAFPCGVEARTLALEAMRVSEPAEPLFP